MASLRDVALNVRFGSISAGDLVPFSLETDEKRWQYRRHVSLADRIQSQLEVGQPGTGMRLLGLILPKLLAHASENTSKPSFDISHVAQFIEADGVLNMYMVLRNCHDELVGEQLFGTKDFVIALELVDEPSEYGDREVDLAIENAVGCVRREFLELRTHCWRDVP